MVRPCLLGPTLFRLQPSGLPRVFWRHKSITAAIERGKQYSEAYTGQNRGRTRRPDHLGRPPYEQRNTSRGPWREKLSSDGPPARVFRDSKSPRDLTRRDSKDSRSPSEFRASRDSREIRRPRDSGASRVPRNSRDFGAPKDSRDFGDSGASGASREKRAFEESRTPWESRRESRKGWPLKESEPKDWAESLPYTTAASEFLYGYSTVLAAIRANRRKLYKLYIHTRGLNHEGRDALVARAKAIRLSVHEVGDEYLRLMDKASSGRPHNGFIMEVSPLPQLPITQMGPSSVSGYFKVGLDTQSREDAIVNGTRDHYTYNSAGWRHPLLLYVDGVLDEGNLGAIARSAYFLGVDAIATPTRQSAPWSHIALKASAGAAEAIPIFKVNQPSDFLGRSARAGWMIYASDAVPAEEQRRASITSSHPSQEPAVDVSSNVVYTYARGTKRMPSDHCPLASHATILMMGAEGTGLRSSLLNQAHYKVGIRNGRTVDEVGVDSLNVSVAASLLCYEMMQKPKAVQTRGEDLLF